MKFNKGHEMPKNNTEKTIPANMLINNPIVFGGRYLLFFEKI